MLLRVSVTKSNTVTKSNVLKVSVTKGKCY